MINLIPIPFFIAFMIGDMIGRKKNNLKLVAVCQPMTTAMAALTALLSFFESYRTTYTVWILVGMAVSVFADSILVSRTDKSAFIKGMGLFLIAILVYGITWTRLSGFRPEDRVITIVMMTIYVICAFIFLNGRNGVDGKPSMKVTIAALVYLLAFCLVISRAISTFYGDYFTTLQSILLTTGIVSFFLGDCQLGTYHFIDKNFPMGQAPPFYFIGQLLIALSCSYF